MSSADKESSDEGEEEYGFVIYDDDNDDDDDDSEDVSLDVPASTADASSAEPTGATYADIQSLKKRSRKRARNFDTIKTSKAYKQIQLTESELEEEVADACGLQPYGLNDHEHMVLHDDLNEELYFQVGREGEGVSYPTVCPATPDTSKHHLCACRTLRSSWIDAWPMSGLTAHT